MKTKKIISFSLYTIAIILIVINTIGIFMSLRNLEIYTENNTFFKNDITLTQEQLLEILDEKENSKQDFALKANDAINKGIAHYWLDEGIDKYNLRIPIFENYILFLSSYAYPVSFEKYQFIDYQKAIERGVGLCSQHSIILSEILEKNDIDSKIVGLSGHVVVMANIDKKKDLWWILDPDYGVTIKHNISQIEEKPEIITAYYSEKGYNDVEIEKLVNIYGSEGNIIHDGVLEYNNKNKYYFEKLSYVAIWVLPLILIFLAFRLRKRA